MSGLSGVVGIEPATGDVVYADPHDTSDRWTEDGQHLLRGDW